MWVILSVVLLISAYPEVRDKATVPSGSFSSPNSSHCAVLVNF